MTQMTRQDPRLETTPGEPLHEAHPAANAARALDPQARREHLIRELLAAHGGPIDPWPPCHLCRCGFCSVRDPE